MFNGSFVPAGTPSSDFESMRFLNTAGIMARYKLRYEEMVRIRQKLRGMKLRDILFSYPDGPDYHIALYLIATSR